MHNEPRHNQIHAASATAFQHVTRLDVDSPFFLQLLFCLSIPIQLREHEHDIYFIWTYSTRYRHALLASSTTNLYSSLHHLLHVEREADVWVCLLSARRSILVVFPVHLPHAARGRGGDRQAHTSSAPQASSFHPDGPYRPVSASGKAKSDGRLALL